MPSVDNRVVEMKFDNNEFESKISKTLSSLKHLKESLSFGNETKNLDALSKTGKEFSLEGIGAAVEGISNKFSAMGAVAFTVISNITTQALYAGERIVKGFSVAPILTGIQEYETGLTSLQTISANTDGKSTMPQITEALDKLNEYSDQTIYNFGQMARNIGTFTAAGVNLDASVGAIKGIANLSALSGSNAEQASGAMYQLSQAMSSGSLRAQDWISVVNAGIGGAVFKSSLFEAAKSLGTITDSPVGQTFEEWTKAGGNFKDAMAEGVFTAEVLGQALSTFTGDLTAQDLAAKGYTETQIKQILRMAEVAKKSATEVKTFSALVGTVKEAIGSGWAQTAKLFIGNIDEAKTLFTGINDVISSFIGRITVSRNNIVRWWGAFGGREELIQVLRNVFWSLALVLGTVHKAFREVFPKKTAYDFLILTKRIQEFTKNAIPTQETIEKIGRIFKGVFSVFSIGISVVKAIFRVFSSLFGIFNHFNGGGFVLEFFAKIADKATWLKEVLDSGGGLDTFVNKYVEPIAGFIKKLNFGPAIDAIVYRFSIFKDALDNVVSKIDFGAKFQPLVDGFNRLKDAISNFFTGGFSSASVDMGGSAERLERRFESFLKIGEKFGEFFSWIGEKVEPIAAVFKNIFAKIGEALKGGDFQPIKDALNVGLFATILVFVGKFLRDGIPFDIGGGMFKKIGNSFRELTGVFKSMQADIKADALMRIAKAMVLLTASLLVLSLIDSPALTKAFLAIGLGFAALTHVMKQMDKIAGTGKQALRIGILSGALIGLSIAIGLLSVSILILSKVDQKELDKGLTAVTLLILGIAAAIKLMGDPKEMGKVGLGVLGLALSLGILIGVIVVLAKIDNGVLVKGMLALGVLLTELTLSIRNIPNDTGVKATAIIGFALALLILTKVVQVFGDMDIKDMLRGLVGVGVTLAILVAALNNMPKDLPKMALSLIGISVGLYAMSVAVKAFGDMDNMYQGLAGIGLALVIIAVGARALDGAKEGILAMILAAGAIVLLGTAFKIFEQIGIVGIIATLIGVALTFIVIAGAATILEFAVPAMLAFGGALLLIAQGMALLGFSFVLFGGGLLLIGLGIKNFVDLGGENLKKFLDMLPGLTVALVKAVALAMLTFAQELGPVIVEFVKLGLVLIESLKILIPKVQEVFSAMISAIFKTISDNSSQFFTIGFQVLTDFLRGISDNISAITTTISDIVIKFQNALTLKLPEIVESGVNLLVAFLDGITNNVVKIAESVSKLIEQWLTAIGEPERIRRMAVAGGRLLGNMLDGFADALGEVVPKVLQFITRVANELLTRSNVQKLVDAGYTVAMNLLHGIADSIDKNSEEMGRAVGHLAGSLIKGIVRGLRAGGSEVTDALKELAGEMLSSMFKFWEVKSPSKVTARLAGYIAGGFADGFRMDTSAAKGAGRFGEGIVASLNSALVQASRGIENMDEFNPTIAPVIDMTNIEKGASKMHALMEPSTITSTVSFEQAASLAVASRASEQTAQDPTESASGVTEIKFEQNNYSPKALTTAELYRNTRSQIFMAKEELNV